MVVLRIILGALYTGMGLAQLVSWREMPGIIGGYQVVPAALLPWSVAALIGAQLLAGIWLLARSRSRNLAPVWIYTVVAAFWTLLGALAFLRGSR